MSLNLVLSSPSKGELFISTFQAIEERHEVPTIRLPDFHPFTTLWRNHLLSLSRHGGPCDAVVDAFVAIAVGNPSWKEGAAADKIASLKTEMRHLLTENPPNVVLVVGLGDFPKVYGLHLRESNLWPFIGMSYNYIKLWMEAKEGSESSLGLTALILTSLDHEIAHWIHTLRAGYPSTSPSNGASINGGSSTSDEINCTSKFLNPPWFPRQAGNYVEVATRGGIMEYSKKTNKAYLVVGDDISDIHTLPASYLTVFLPDCADPTATLLFKSGSAESDINNFTFGIYDSLRIPYMGKLCLTFGDVDSSTIFPHTWVSTSV